MMHWLVMDMLGVFRRRKVVDLEPESVSTAIIRLETLTDRIQATATVLEQLVAKLRQEEEEAADNGR